MTKTRLRETILKGNKKKLIALAKTYGLTLKDFLYMLGTIDWYCLNRDTMTQRKLEGKNIPKELEYLMPPRPIQIDKSNTERLEVEVDIDVEFSLKIKCKQYGIRTIGILLDKIVSEQLQLINPDLINEIKQKGGKNGEQRSR